MIGTYIFIILDIRVKKNYWRSLTRVENCMYAHAGLKFVSCCNHNHHRKLQSASIVIWWKLLFYSTILFLPFPRLHKAELTWSLDDTMMRLKISGVGSAALKFIKIDRIIIKKKKRWLKLMCWHFCYLADKRTDKWLPSVCQLITGLGGYLKLFIIPVGQLGKCQHWPKPLIICQKPSRYVGPFTCRQFSTAMIGAIARHCMFEGGNLLNMNLTPVTNIPWKLCNFASCATQLQNHLCQHQSDLLFHFWGNCVNSHLPTTIRKCVCNITCAACAHTQKKWPFLLHGPSIIRMQFIMLCNHHEQTSQ